MIIGLLKLRVDGTVPVLFFRFGSCGGRWIEARLDFPSAVYEERLDDSLSRSFVFFVG